MLAMPSVSLISIYGLFIPHVLQKVLYVLTSLEYRSSSICMHTLELKYDKVHPTFSKFMSIILYFMYNTIEFDY